MTRNHPHWAFGWGRLGGQGKNAQVDVDHRDTVWTTYRISQALETSGQEHGQVNIFLKSLTPDQVADKKINLPERIQLFSEPIPLSYEKAKDLYDVYVHLPEQYRSLSFLEYGLSSFSRVKKFTRQNTVPRKHLRKHLRLYNPRLHLRIFQ